MRQELLDEVLGTPRFRRALAAAARGAIVADLPSVEPREVDSEADWPYAILCCSILASSENEAAQDAVLRIAQSCLQDEHTTDEEKAAAALLLERLGNAPALELATSRSMVERDSWMDPDSPLTLDAIRSRMELGVPMLHASTVHANRFQRRRRASAGTPWERSSARASDLEVHGRARLLDGSGVLRGPAPVRGRDAAGPNSSAIRALMLSVPDSKSRSRTLELRRCNPSLGWGAAPKLSTSSPT